MNFRWSIPLFVVVSCILLSCSHRDPIPPPPVAEVIPTSLEKHGSVRTDNYYWLKDRTNPKVIEYLKAENRYLDTVMSHTKTLQETIFEEIKRRIKQTDMSVPYKLDDYWYYTRFDEGKEYPLYCRKRDSLSRPEELMINANALAAGHGFFNVGGFTVSHKQDILAYCVDTVGRRFYTIRFKNLRTGELLPDVLPNVTPNMVWANDNATLFYTRQDPTTLRSYRVYTHRLGTPAQDDKVVYEEKDETFGCSVFRTRSKQFIMIACSQTLSDEYRFVNAFTPHAQFTLFMPRERNHEYSIDHYNNAFYIRTNWEAKNFRLMKTPVTATAKKNWTEVLPHRTDVLLSDFEIFRDHLVLTERAQGLTRIRVMPWSGGPEHYLDFGEPAYLAAVSMNPEVNTTILRYVYTSLTTPSSVFDYEMNARTKVLLKQDEVVGGYNPADYATERLSARAPDGTEVPLSIVYKKGFAKDGSRPLLLYGYGSYGASTDATFSSARLSLLDRGFAFAIAHVRGGQELGRQWYDNGKLLNKKNTFTDFIACAEYLTHNRYTAPSKLFAQGGSAGGLLMGAVVNLRPDLFKGVIAAVPFVDVVTTMLDESIPLTTAEFDEWGNPNDKQYYDYMFSYSPYDNVEAKEYPNLLVTTGLHDSQVQYWEPAKWVAKLRATKKGQSLVLLKTNMEAGHGGASGRFRRLRETALQYAFVLDLAGISQ